MIEGDFDSAEGAETIGSSGGELGLVVEALDGAAGDGALDPEPVEQQRAMAAEHAGDFLHGLQARAPRPGVPPTQEATRPGGGGCEARYDHFSGDRFRHGTKFLRWRSDENPRDCTF